jgi:hypothetical protein
MRKQVLSLSLLILLAGCGSTFAEAAKTAPTAPVSMHIETPAGEMQEAAEVKTLLADLLQASNRHDIDGVLKHYSPGFSSGDSLSLKDIRSLILDTWKMFPDIKYESQILEMRINGKWATVESIDTATATAKVDPVVSDKPGIMKSRSRGLLYLHKVGKIWEILSDYTLYEKAVITYGPFENINIDVATPEQVFAGESYTAQVAVGVPTGNIAFATLTQEPLTYPQNVSKDKFRTLSTDKTDLERIFKANATNNNEVVTATVGFTEIGQDDQDRPTINLKGIMTVVKRVNVIPRSTFQAIDPEQRIVHTTVDGKVKVEPMTSSDTTGEDESESPEQPGGPASPQD